LCETTPLFQARQNSVTDAIDCPAVSLLVHLSYLPRRLTNFGLHNHSFIISWYNLLNCIHGTGQWEKVRFCTI
jgi:hypothetical protein